MFGIGMPEMILILAVALIIIGPKKLPDLAKSLGRAIGEFRKATSDLKDSFTGDDELKGVKTAFEDLNKDVNASIDKTLKNPAPIKNTGDDTSANDSSPPDNTSESDKNA